MAIHHTYLAFRKHFVHVCPAHWSRTSVSSNVRLPVSLQGVGIVPLCRRKLLCTDTTLYVQDANKGFVPKSVSGRADAS